ncbi:C-terminal novel E3 ligase, LRR-interacting [Pseudomonas sp. Z003-0.4C(8344-21)]|uniref:NEL-type E3 ubiquitin ligase domain-containing protein n=1 Tax=Pseudomonas sp. Z003-0.4C(8344-21) TaxID=1855380 RepID=UPI000879953B|nr:NEL-type E3 ubiquitin ligase domain-containing protein [Pseudomonas sp. Z003-0.4C(8344-21)]SDS59583.1 C-terminal novel E3 ligase, LRR-interacting [Pseudomonas sp. Z003-0.4C(8344-21)]
MPATVNKTSPSDDAILGTLLEATADLDTAQTLQKTLPAHLLKASPEALSALDQTVRDLHDTQVLVDKDLLALKPLNSFCIDELHAALSGKWPADTFDVEKDFLSLPGVDCGCPATSTDENGIQTFPNATPTLLQAAMQNFSEDEAADTFPRGSFIRINSAAQAVSDLTPAAFAKLCRELDLGKRYQEHFQKVFGLLDRDGKVVATSAMTRDIAKLKKLLLQLDLQQAALKGNISAATRQVLQKLIDADGVLSSGIKLYGKQAMIMQGVKILDSCVWGAVVFSSRSVELYPSERCVVYIAGEPQRPLYEYPSFTVFKQYLTQQMQKKDYREYFANSLDEDNKADFFKTFTDSVELGHIQQWPMTVPLFEFMVQSHVGKLQLDARKLAVPTDDIDEEVRQKRLLDFIQRGVTVLSVAGLVVPVLGQLMMGVAVGQMLAEVYEGVEDWRRGDHQQALSHLLSVVENIAVMGGFAVGQKAVATLGKKLLQAHPQFFAQFSAIVNGAGQPRLWKPDLAPYEHSLPTGFTIAPGSKEFYQIGDKTLSRIDHRIFAGDYDPASKVWRLQHARRASAYVPQITRHVEGGWRLPAEQPEEWSSVAYALKRVDPSLSEFDDSDLDMLRRLCDVTPEELHEAFRDNVSLSVRLRETIERVRLARQLRTLSNELQRGEVHSGQAVEDQLHALPKMRGWPTDRYIEVTDPEGTVTATYPRTTVFDESLGVVVDTDQLARGQLLQTIIDGLYQSEVEALLGSKVATSAQHSTLAKKLGAALKTGYREAFEHMYQRYDQGDVDEVLKLRKVFADIPARHVQSLIEQAPSVQRLHLRTTGRVPLQLGQRVRITSSQVRLDRSLAGFHWPRLANADTDKLAIQLLPRLRGWDSQVRLEIRDKKLTGPILQAIGEESATVSKKCTLVKSATGYEAFDGSGKSQGKVAAGPNALFDAILKAVPTKPSKGVAAAADTLPTDAAGLRSQLLEKALGEREATARLLSGDESAPLDAEPACVQGDQPAVKKHPSALLRKVRKLFPRMTEAQASEFIDGLGDDALSRAMRVKVLRGDLDSLRDALFTWGEDIDAMNTAGGDLAEVRHSRRTFAELIEKGFRRFHQMNNENGKAVGVLNLDGMRVGKLPTLPPGISFDHIQQLSMRDMALDDDVAYFLKSFKQLESLELDDNVITRLPEVLSHMPNLKVLSLAGNKLQLTEQTLKKLNGLHTLRHLNLNKNPLGATPDVSRMFHLRRLLLESTGITEMPKGLSRLLNLEWADLKKNQIKYLPDWLFKTSRRFSQALDLGDNPLIDPSKTHLQTYRDNYGVGMGFFENDIARLDEQRARTLWFPEKAGETFGKRERIWNAFKDDARAEGLFHLLAELGNTADSKKINKELQRRVWAVLEAAENDAALCDHLLGLAASPINCTDTAAVTFSRLEVAVQVNRLTRLAGSNGVSARSLLKLGRGLFRLEQLDDIAAEHAVKFPKLDPLEVGLAYRIGLAETLELPGQARHMLFGEQAGVTEADLEVAQNRISVAELSPKWLKFMSERTFWQVWLQRTFPRRFVPVEEEYAPRMTALDEKAKTMRDADYRSQADIIKAEREEAFKVVWTELTEEALRIEELGLCARPDD